MNFQLFYKILYTFLCLLFFSNSLFSQKSENQFYSLKIYSYSSLKNEKQIDVYLRDTYLPALKKLSISPVGVFKLKAQSNDTIRRTYVLVPLKSLDNVYTLDDKISRDSIYISSGEDFLNAPFDNAPYDRMKTIILKAFDEMPFLQPPFLNGSREERLYELRSYESPTVKLHKNKVKMFNEGGEIKLFKNLGFNAVFYSSVIAGSQMPNLMYMTAFDDKKSRDAHWDAFRKSPAWKKLSSLPEYQNNVSDIDIVFLYPTSYSDY